MRDSHVITNFMCLGSGVARGEGRGRVLNNAILYRQH